jgi:chromate transporter
MRIQRGLAPLAVGLMLSSGFIVATGSNPNLATLGVTVISLIVFMRFNIHPVPLMAVGALIAIAGLI